MAVDDARDRDERREQDHRTSREKLEALGIEVIPAEEARKKGALLMFGGKHLAAMRGAGSEREEPMQGLRDVADDAGAGTAAETPEVRPAMSAAEIAAAGLAVDLPFESGSSDPFPLVYGDAEDMESRGVEAWVPPPGWPESWRAQVSRLKAPTPENLDPNPGEDVKETPPDRKRRDRMRVDDET